MEKITFLWSNSNPLCFQIERAWNPCNAALALCWSHLGDVNTYGYIK